MPHRPSTVHRRILAAAGAALLAAGLAPSASAETLLTGPDAPLVVQGNACVGVACASGTAPSGSFVLRTNDTPLVRLDQASGGGFTAQTWDVGGNEANFFVRDLTAGSRLPFRIAPGAPTNNLTLRAGYVGIGTWTPSKRLDIVGSDGDTAVKLTEESATVAPRTLADLTNRGPVAVRLADSDANVGWTMATAADGTVSLTPDGPGPLPSLVLSKSGDVTAGGVVQQAADPARRTGVRAADEAAIAAAIRALPIERFGLAGDDSGAEHLAPSGEAFRDAFGLGSSDALIAPGDVGAVALVGVKALLDGGAGETGDLVRALAERTDALETGLAAAERRGRDQDQRLGSAEQVAHGHERRMRTLEHQATLAEQRFQRSRRTQRRLSGQVSTLRRENARLEQRLAAVEAAVAKLR